MVAPGIAMSAPATREPSEFAHEHDRLRRFAAMAPDDPERAALREDLILTFLPVGERIAARYSAGRPGARDDLRQVASLAVIKTIDRWDPERAEGDVLGYLVPCVRGELMRWFRDRTWALRVPRRLKDLSVSISRATGELTHQLGRAPKPSELARALDVDVEEVLEALQAEANHEATSLDAPPPGDASTAGYDVSEIDSELERVEDVATPRPLLDKLPERERRIILLRFFGGRTQSQIAAEIGISQMHVSRLLARTLEKMRVALMEDPPE